MNLRDKGRHRLAAFQLLAFLPIFSYISNTRA
jgi:hypothetical protein